MKNLFLIICMVITTISSAKKWDSLYINDLIKSGNIDKVIDYYQDQYNGKNRIPQDAFKIAALYVKKKEYANAVQWYEKEKQLIDLSKEILFDYANANRFIGNYQKALDSYLMYAAITGDASKVMSFANQCELILKLSAQTANYKLDHYTYNSFADETNVATLRTNIIYNKIELNKDKKQTYSIYQVVRNFETFAEPVKAYRNNISNLIITSVSYTKDGNTVIFSAKEEKSTDINNEQLYIAENLAGNFLNIKSLSFNKANYSFKNPSFNDDGTSVYFTSNQPNGFGGFDIWNSKFEKGKWITPVNLGNLVNSAADEMNPFLVQDGYENTLYFSSNRKDGFGGFDIFLVNRSNNIWQDATIQPPPINSDSDDISIIYDREINTGYFSSNRSGGKGGFDLYRFTPFNLSIIINAIDAATNKPAGFAFTQLIENDGKAWEGMTDENGKISFQVAKNKSFKISVAKDNYQQVTVNTNTIGKENGDSVKIKVLLNKDIMSSNSLSMDNYIIFTGHVLDSVTHKPAVNAKMRMINYATQRIRELDIDKDGKFEIKLLLNNNYKIIFENQSSKIIDEISTFGLKKNEIKVRDFVL